MTKVEQKIKFSQFTGFHLNLGKIFVVFPLSVLKVLKETIAVRKIFTICQKSVKTMKFSLPQLLSIMVYACTYGMSYIFLP